nr:uncharacterized protein LOC111502813 [Leptinotarsa decemlineata]XP_023012753.1 uncharacterized protein LOC111502813 [Leptinotarsa decemlineata]
MKRFGTKSYDSLKNITILSTHTIQTKNVGSNETQKSRRKKSVKKSLRGGSFTSANEMSRKKCKGFKPEAVNGLFRCPECYGFCSKTSKFCKRCVAFRQRNGIKKNHPKVKIMAEKKAFLGKRGNRYRCELCKGFCRKHVRYCRKCLRSMEGEPSNSEKRTKIQNELYTKQPYSSNSNPRNSYTNDDKGSAKQQVLSSSNIPTDTSKTNSVDRKMPVTLETEMISQKQVKSKISKLEKTTRWKRSKVVEADSPVEVAPTASQIARPDKVTEKKTDEGKTQPQKYLNDLSYREIISSNESSSNADESLPVIINESDSFVDDCRYVSFDDIQGILNEDYTSMTLQELL